MVSASSWVGGSRVRYVGEVDWEELGIDIALSQGGRFVRGTLGVHHGEGHGWQVTNIVPWKYTRRRHGYRLAMFTNRQGIVANIKIKADRYVLAMRLDPSHLP